MVDLAIHRVESDGLSRYQLIGRVTSNKISPPTYCTISQANNSYHVVIGFTHLPSGFHGTPVMSPPLCSLCFWQTGGHNWASCFCRTLCRGGWPRVLQRGGAHTGDKRWAMGQTGQSPRRWAILIWFSMVFLSAASFETYSSTKGVGRVGHVTIILIYPYTSHIPKQSSKQASFTTGARKSATWPGLEKRSGKLST